MRKIAALFTFVLTMSIMSIPALALADEPPSREQKKKSGDKSSSCSVAAEDNGLIGVAAGVLLIAGVALRRRS